MPRSSVDRGTQPALPMPRPRRWTLCAGGRLVRRQLPVDGVESQCSYFTSAQTRRTGSVKSAKPRRPIVRRRSQRSTEWSTLGGTDPLSAGSQEPRPAAALSHLQATRATAPGRRLSDAPLGPRRGRRLRHAFPAAPMRPVPTSCAVPHVRWPRVARQRPASPAAPCWRMGLPRRGSGPAWGTDSCRPRRSGRARRQPVPAPHNTRTTTRAGA